MTHFAVRPPANPKIAPATTTHYQGEEPRFKHPRPRRRRAACSCFQRNSSTRHPALRPPAQYKPCFGTFGSSDCPSGSGFGLASLVPPVHQGCIKLAIPTRCGRDVSPKRPCLSRGGRLGEASLPELDAALPVHSLPFAALAFFTPNRYVFKA